METNKTPKLMNFDVLCSVYDMKNGEVISVKIEDVVFDRRNNIDEKIELNSKKYYKHHIKESYIQKYVKANHVGMIFKLEDFLRVYPKQKHNKQLKHNIAVLIEKGIIRQWNHKDEFQIVKKIK